MKTLLLLALTGCRGAEEDLWAPTTVEGVAVVTVPTEYECCDGEDCQDYIYIGVYPQGEPLVERCETSRVALAEEGPKTRCRPAPDAYTEVVGEQIRLACDNPLYTIHPRDITYTIRWLQVVPISTLSEEP